MQFIKFKIFLSFKLLRCDRNSKGSGANKRDAKLGENLNQNKRKLDEESGKPNKKAKVRQF